MNALKHPFLVRALFWIPVVILVFAFIVSAVPFLALFYWAVHRESPLTSAVNKLIGYSAVDSFVNAIKSLWTGRDFR